MSARGDAADRYAEQAVQGCACCPWLPDGRRPDVDDARSVAEEAFAAGWDAALDRIAWAARRTVPGPCYGPGCDHASHPVDNQRIV